MLVKIHNAYRTSIAICDLDLLGKKFEEESNEKTLEIDLTGSFFQGQEKSEEEIEKIVKSGLEEDATFNIVGKKSCDLMKKLGVVSDSSILRISGIPVSLSLM